jgi:hypothetical protein
MSGFTRKRPSPALVISMIALFVSLGGVSYGVATSSIGSKQIKNNSILTQDIKNRTIRGKDIHKRTIRGSNVGLRTLTGANVGNDKLTGKQVLESSLGTVPSATSAGVANNASNVSTLVNFPIKGAAAAADLASAPEVPIGSKGPFRFYGKCFLTAGPAQVHSDIYIAVASGTSLFDTEAEDSGYLTAATPEASRQLQDVAAAANTVAAGDGDKDFNATDGVTSITGVVGLAAAKQGSPPGGDGPFGAPGNRCLFGGTVLG